MNGTDNVLLWINQQDGQTVRRFHGQRETRPVCNNTITPPVALRAGDITINHRYLIPVNLLNGKKSFAGKIECGRQKLLILSDIPFFIPYVCTEIEIRKRGLAYATPPSTKGVRDKAMLLKYRKFKKLYPAALAKSERLRRFCHCTLLML
jgi:hypothetical protein